MIRVPLPRTHGGFKTYSYINSLTVNNKVILPLFGVPEDEIALRIYEDVMPQYNIVGIDYQVYPVGAVHCQTKEVPAVLTPTINKEVEQ